MAVGAFVALLAFVWLGEPIVRLVHAVAGGPIDGPLVTVSVLGGLTLLLVAITGSLFSVEAGTRSAGVVAIVLLGSGLWLAAAGTASPDDPAGNSFYVQVLTETGTGDPPPLYVVLRANHFYLHCLTCTPKDPVLVALHGNPEIFGEVDVRSLPDPSPDDVALLGTVEATNPATELDEEFTLVELSGPSAVYVFVSRGHLVETGGARTKITSPFIRVAFPELVASLDEADIGQWGSPTSLDVQLVAGSAAGPAGSWDGDYRIDFVAPPPERTDQFFIRWQTGDTDVQLMARATVVSPTRERTQTLRTLLAGALIGGGTLPTVQVASDHLRSWWLVRSDRRSSRRARRQGS